MARTVDTLDFPYPASIETPHEQTALDRQISATDTQIDCLVYDLYGLMEDEIKLVEGAWQVRPLSNSTAASQKARYPRRCPKPCPEAGHHRLIPSNARLLR